MIELVKHEKDNGLYQWDTGRKVQLTDESLSIAEVHFSNIYLPEALIVEPNGDDTADIPNILLQYSVELAIYAVLKDADGEQTIYETRMSVRKRAKPSDYVYTETEIKNWDVLEKRIKESEDNQTSDEVIKEAVESYLEKNPVKIEVDDVLSEQSENPVANKAIAKSIKEVEEKIPTDYVSEEELENKGYLTKHQPLDAYAKKSELPTTPESVGADAKGTADAKVDEHNISETAHNDIRILIKNLTTKVTTLLDSDDESLDQMSEIVTYIKSNRSLIDAITTSKVSVDDIVDNLTTSLSNKPLSAKQGVALKSLFDEVKTSLGKIVIPTELPNPQKLTFDGAVSAEYDGSGAVVVTIPSGQGTQRIEKDAVDTEVTLEPNKLYVFPEMATLNVALSDNVDTSVADEFHFVFKSGATATTLTLPETIVMPDGFSVDANKIYEISILETMMLAKSWAVS